MNLGQKDVPDGRPPKVWSEVPRTIEVAWQSIRFRMWIKIALWIWWICGRPAPVTDIYHIWYHIFTRSMNKNQDVEIPRVFQWKNQVSILIMERSAFWFSSGSPQNVSLGRLKWLWANLLMIKWWKSNQITVDSPVF